MSVELEWSLGPVQSFIAAARRTRDLWGGSYLLSLLVAEAIAASGLPPDAFTLPTPSVVRDDQLICACRHRRSGAGSRYPLEPQAGLPNHVQVQVGDEEAETIAELMTGAAKGLWQELCEEVWGQFVAPAALTPAVRAIWDRQLAACWEITWVAAQPGHAALARRKVWRTHLLPDEPGDRCMVQPEYQELSGELGTTGSSARLRQGAFWEAVRQSTGDYEVRPDERLCAPVLVKRLWPKVAQKLRPDLPDGTGWPSTLHLALASWIELAVTAWPALADKLADDIAEAAPRAYQVRSLTPLPGLTEHKLWGVDPELLFDAATNLPEVAAARSRLCSQIGPPSRFFAVVLADGDRVGEASRRLGGAVVGNALARFGHTAGRVAAQAHAVVVYAGGDDLLALAPVEGALDLVDHLEQAYRSSFEALVSPGATVPSLSAAVVFSHARAPLTDALAAARELLDEEAKERNGRASVAVAVRRRGGEGARWVRAFGPANHPRPLEELRAVVSQVAAADRAMSTAALYRATALVRRLLWPCPSAPGAQGELTLGDPSLLVALVGTELARDDNPPMGPGPRAGTSGPELAERVVGLLRSLPGPDATDRAGDSRVDRYDLDLLPLLRFLVTGGKEEP